MKLSSSKLALFLKIFLALVIILSLGKFFLIKSDQKNSDSTQISKEDFAICLKKSGILMYGEDTCEYCQIQKKMFGSAFDQINYINCQFEKELCRNKGIESFPVWEKNGQWLRGIQDFQSLATVSGCLTPNK